jgi:hypothetical protein
LNSIEWISNGKQKGACHSTKVVQSSTTILELVQFSSRLGGKVMIFGFLCLLGEYEGLEANGVIVIDGSALAGVGAGLSGGRCRWTVILGAM